MYLREHDTAYVMEMFNSGNLIGSTMYVDHHKDSIVDDIYTKVNGDRTRTYSTFGEHPHFKNLLIQFGEKYPELTTQQQTAQ